MKKIDLINKEDRLKKSKKIKLNKIISWLIFKNY